MANPLFRNRKKLTSNQIKKLAALLIGTGKNVFSVCKSEFLIKVDDAIFDKLEKTGIFKCAECNLWLSVDERDSKVSDTCIPCVSDIEDMGRRIR